MTDILKRELYISIQFLLIAFVALIVAFFGMLPGGGDGEFPVAINISEACKNVAPYVRLVLLTFGVLSILRLAAIFLVHSIRRRVG